MRKKAEGGVEWTFGRSDDGCAGCASLFFVSLLGCFFSVCYFPLFSCVPTLFFRISSCIVLFFFHWHLQTSYFCRNYNLATQVVQPPSTSCAISHLILFCMYDDTSVFVKAVIATKLLGRSVMASILIFIVTVLVACLNNRIRATCSSIYSFPNISSTSHAPDQYTTLQHIPSFSPSLAMRFSKPRYRLHKSMSWL